MKTLDISIKPGDTADFSNRTTFCVGTGRMGLALQKEYQEQLKYVQEKCGFRFIRGHGLFSDDMAIYQPYMDENGIEHEAYCFTYLDRVFDSYLALGIRPFLELGFMPSGLASGSQTLFYWKANTTPPKDEIKWVNLVKATLMHLKERYGDNEVSSWPCEIWNEPNLPGFWENADKPAYLRLYEITAKAVKDVLPRMRIGGPAICGGNGSQEWVRDFLAFCRDLDLPVDFVTRHAYMGLTPSHKGRYLYHEMREIPDIMDEMNETRRIIDSFESYRDKPMYITEFSTSYHPFCPIHDTALNAAVTAGLLSRLGEVAEGYSYWTFGDVFEECGVPSRPFHGGFGMIANQLIPKPTLWVFRFFANLKGQCVYKGDNLLVMQHEDGSFEGIAWNPPVRGKTEELTVSVRLPVSGKYCALSSTVDEKNGNPLPLWLKMGEPASLTDAQLSYLREAAHPRCEAYEVDSASEGVHIELTLGKYAVTHFTVSPVTRTRDFGYAPEMYI